MTNDEKAKEIVLKAFEDGFYHFNSISQRKRFEKSLIEMAKWKDEEHKKDMENLILKATNYIYNHAHVTTFGDIRLDKESMTQFVEDFKKAMICGT